MNKKVRACIECRQEFPLDAEHFVRRGKKWFVSRCKPCNREYHRVNYKHTYRLRTYGITEEQYQEMLKRQDGKCAICDSPDKKLVIDHDHLTGKVRGLLCNQCNKGIGSLQDKIWVILGAVNYLAKHNKTQSGSMLSRYPVNEQQVST